MKLLLFLHRWLGVALCVVFLLPAVQSSEKSESFSRVLLLLDLSGSMGLVDEVIEDDKPTPPTRLDQVHALLTNVHAPKGGITLAGKTFAAGEIIPAADRAKATPEQQAALTPFVASLLSDHADELFSPKSGSFMGFLAATSLVFAVAFLDDLRLTSPWLRSAVFAIAGAAVYAAGYRIDDVGLPLGPDLHLWPAVGLLVTIAWIWLTTNAFNIIDGCTEGKSREPLRWLFAGVAGKVDSRFTQADIL